MTFQVRSVSENLSRITGMNIFELAEVNITGLGSAILDVFVLSSVGLYFKKHRFLANSVASSGDSVGGMVLPHLVRLVLQEYGIRGGMMLLAGVWLQILVVAFIMRHLTRHDREYLHMQNSMAKTAEEPQSSTWVRELRKGYGQQR